MYDSAWLLKPVEIAVCTDRNLTAVTCFNDASSKNCSYAYATFHEMSELVTNC